MPAGIRIEGLKELTRTIEQMPVKVQKVVDAELSDGANRVAKLAKQLAPKDESRITQAITPVTNTFLHKEVVCNVYYAGYMEFGTGKKVKINPGLESIASELQNQPKRGNFDDMVKSLAGWLSRHGGNPKHAKSMAYIILKNGLKPRPFFFKAYDALKQDIKDKIKKAIG